MDGLFLAFFLIVFAGLFGGSWGLGMKYIKPLSFEAFWLVFSILAFIVFPILWASLAIPDLWASILAVSHEVLWTTLLIGFIWGPAMFMFGIAVRYIGVSIVYGIVMGMSALMGSVVPLLLLPDTSGNPAVPFIISGVMVMLAGIIIAAIAGLRRDKIHSQDNVEVEGLQKGKNVRKGILLAFLCGIFGSLMNIGFAQGAPIAESAVNYGASTGSSSLAVWVVLYIGGFISNALFALLMLTRNRTWNTFSNAGLSKAIMWAGISALACFAGAAIYGQGAVILGKIGPVIGWPIHLSVVIIFSNFWGLRTGEWKGAMKAFRLIIISVIIFLIANFILGYSNSLY